MFEPRIVGHFDRDYRLVYRYPDSTGLESLGTYSVSDIHIDRICWAAVAFETSLR